MAPGRERRHDEHTGMEQSMDGNKLIISWLNDALAMENALV